MRYCFLLLVSFFVISSLEAQGKDIEIFEKKEGNKNIVVARNTGKVSYLVRINITSTGMIVKPGFNVEAVVPAGYMKEMATIEPKPGESWSYGFDASFIEYRGDPLNPPTSEVEDEATTPEVTSSTATPPPVLQASLSTAPIIVYTQVGCGRCSYVKKEMTAKDIVYEEVDVNSGSPEANNMWKQLRDGGFTGTSVTMPVVKANGELHYNIKDLAGFVNGLK